jgi:pilus assembly protein Flp/PilA
MMDEMRSPSQTLRPDRFALDESGATAIEYALIAGGISIAIITAVTSIGSTMNSLYYDKLLNMF